MSHVELPNRPTRGEAQRADIPTSSESAEARRRPPLKVESITNWPCPCKTPPVNDHRTRLLRRLRSLETAEPPPLWQHLTTAAVGGLVAVGFEDDSSALLVVSWSGRSLFDVSTGERLARDRDDDVAKWTSADYVAAQGIGPLEGVPVVVAGLWGGGLQRVTADDWSVSVVAPDWPDERVILQPPGCGILSEGHSDGCVQIAQPSNEVRACGFSRDGTTLVLATTSDLSIWSR